MTPERWGRVNDLFAEALRRDADGRRALLRDLHEADPSLGREVEGLLDADREADRESFLSPLTVPLPDSGSEPEPGPARRDPEGGGAMIGRRVGPYEIVAAIASGGMGSVYRAVRVDEFRQEVAIKLVRPGAESDDMLRRFLGERQVLAGLNHPHIARLLDGGTTPDGRPFFVMEYIDGRPLDRYADARRLDTRQRLRLLEMVCRAVHHAHGRAVVHRDLKPSNILVTADGTPKVTDFGLAKRLDAEGPRTLSGHVLGTPSYMAPEQARGQADAIGPATDVYALGAILYELLTGRPPFRGESPWDTVRQVLSDDPLPPSRLHPRLARDVETICLKCLQKEPSRRYASAEELADEIDRFLTDRPIRARPAPASERVRKWVRRRPAAAALLVAGALAATALLVAAALYVELLRKQRDAAQWQRDRLLLATSQRRLATLYFETNQVGQAEETFREALANLEQLARDDPADLALQRTLADGQMNLGRFLSATNRKEQAEATYRRALEILRRPGLRRPEDRRALALILNNLTACRQSANPGPDDLANLDEALAISEALVRDRPGDPENQRALALSCLNLGIWTATARQGPDGPDKAKGLIGRGIAIYAANPPEDPESLRILARALINQAALEESGGSPGSPEESYQRALTILRGLARDYPKFTAHRVDLAALCSHLGLRDKARRKLREAGERFSESVEVWEGLVRDFPADPEFRAELAVGYADLGAYYRDDAKADRVEETWRKGVSILEPLVRAHPSRSAYRLNLASMCSNLGVFSKARSDLPAAVKWSGEAIEHLGAVVGEGDVAERRTRLLISASTNRASALEALARPREAQADWDRAVDLASGRRREELRLKRASTLARLGDHARAVAEAVAAADALPVDGRTRLGLALAHALAARAAVGDDRLSPADRARLSRDYAGHAVRVLAESHAAGQLSGPEWTRMLEGGDLDSLRDRDDFLELLRQVEGAARPPASR